MRRFSRLHHLRRDRVHTHKEVGAVASQQSVSGPLVNLVHSGLPTSSGTRAAGLTQGGIQSDVDEIVCLGLNTVRIPVGWWIIEELKDSNDYFPTGQMAHLKRGLKMLKDAGIHVMLDLHANPGVQSVQQQFTG